MKLNLYNTLTRQKEEFIPIHENEVGMYSCGPTVYYTPHIGNLRATFTADLIRNTLKLLWYKVKAVMNITDVGHLVSDGDEGEDKLEKWSKRDGISAWDVAKKYEKIFKDSMKELNIDEFDVMPRATEHIEKQIELIKILEEKWYTYTVPWDGIYMDTSKVENYGELMWPNYKKRLADLNAGERVDMKGKKNATDFALWKFSPENEKRQMERESPWWIGFPGWHIECSAMSSEYLWQQFDIHHGWADHITIHHPNEIAQSECAFGVHPRVKYRVHNEFLQVDGGKMSKSLGNIYSLEDIKAKWYSPLDLRYFYFMAQYGNFQNFTWDQLEAAKNSRENFKKRIAREKEDKWYVFDENIWSLNIDEMLNINYADSDSKQFLLLALDALSDNINTPLLLSIINTKWLGSKWSMSILYWFEKNFLKIWLFWEKTEVTLIETIKISDEITELAEQRKQAKLDKNYALSDELRNEINSLGREIKDTKDGYEISKI